MASSKIFVDTYTVPPYATATGDPDPQKQLWSPTVITLIHTATSAVICDCAPTTTETQKLADWIKRTIPGKQVKYFFGTHAHGDHFFGFPVLAEHFPGIRPVATKAVAEHAGEQYEGQWGEVWKKWFPDGRLPTEKVVFESLPENNTFDLDGFGIKAHDVEHADTHANSFLHVPALELVVASDIVYGDCYQFLAEATTKSKRDAWVAALDRIAELKPQIVIPGHARSSQVFGAYLIESTKRYIRVFEEQLEEAESAGQLYERMSKLYPERWNLFLLGMSCENSFKEKGK